jgi:hypothetical protein
MAKPVFHAYTIRDYEKDGKKEGFWTKIGVAFSHEDGKGYNIVLDAFPVDGKISLREPRAKEEGGQD